MAKFKFGVPIVAKTDGGPMSLAAAARRVREIVESGEPLLFEGVASSTALDNEGEWFSETCIKSMTTQAPVDLVPCPAEGKHWGVEPGRELGVAKSFSVFEEGDSIKLGVEGELSPEVEQARAIMVNMLAGQPYQLSVTGPVQAAFGVHPVTGKSGRYFEDIRFDHIAVTRGNSLLNPAANPETWMAAVSKAAAEAVASKVYASRDELPDAVQKLPAAAQDIYLAAFNAAYEEYEGDEEKAHATAWAAVKQKYEQDEDGEWIAKVRQPMLPTAKSWLDTEAPVTEVETDEGWEYAVPIVQVEDLQDGPPSAVFAENAERTTGIERYWETVYDFDVFVDQLRLTLRGICGLETPDERVAAFQQAVADFGEAASAGIAEAISKAGARHSKSDKDLLHGAMRTLMDACGCGTCADAVAALIEAETEAASKANTNAAQGAGEEGDIDMSPEQLAEIVSKTVADALAPVTERLDKLETVIAKSGDAETDTPAEDAPAEEAPAAETPAPEAPAETPAEASAEAAPDPEPEAETPAEPEAPAEDPAVAKANAEWQAKYDELAAKVKSLEAQPTAGGPVSTAAAEGDEKLKGSQPESTFEDAVAKAREARGTVEGARAIKDAERKVGQALGQLLAPPTQ